MKSAIGQCIELSLFGESHGEAIGVVIQGLPSGIRIDEAWMGKQMEKRKPKGKISTQRQEADVPKSSAASLKAGRRAHRCAFLSATKICEARTIRKQDIFRALRMPITRRRLNIWAIRITAGAVISQAGSPRR